VDKHEDERDEERSVQLSLLRTRNKMHHHTGPSYPLIPIKRGLRRDECVLSNELLGVMVGFLLSSSDMVHIS